jgi:hypothetical protein
MQFWCQCGRFSVIDCGSRHKSLLCYDLNHAAPNIHCVVERPADERASIWQGKSGSRCQSRIRSCRISGTAPSWRLRSTFTRGLPDAHRLARVARGCQPPTVWVCQTPTLSGFARHPPFHTLWRRLPDTHGCQSPTVWVCQTPILSQPLAKGNLIAANQSEIGLGVWDPLGVWVSGTPGVWVSGTPWRRVF